jgi:hypothetical protein
MRQPADLAQMRAQCPESCDDPQCIRRVFNLREEAMELEFVVGISIIDDA